MRNVLRKDLLIYYGMQVAGLGMPFLLVPFLARVMGPEGFGLVSIGQAFAVIVASVVEYGFQVSGTRRIASNREDILFVAEIASEILSAKLLLSVAAVALLPVAAFAVPVFRHQPELLAASAAFGIFQGLSFYWLFGGIQNYYLAGILELGSRLLAAAIILTVVRHTDDAWIVLMIFACCEGLFVAIGALVYRQTMPVNAFTIAKAKSALSNGRYVFAMNMIGNLYTGTNSFLLGIVASPRDVGFFAGAEKLIRAAMLPLKPLRQVFFPVVAERIARSPQSGAKALWRIAFLTLPIAAIGCILLFVLAPLLVRLALGAQMAQSVPLLRLMAILPVIGVANELISIFWMLPNGMDRQLTRIVGVVAVVHVILMMTLGATMHDGVGGAITVTSSLALSLLFFVITVLRAPVTAGRHEAGTESLLAGVCLQAEESITEDSRSAVSQRLL